MSIRENRTAGNLATQEPDVQKNDDLGCTPKCLSEACSDQSDEGCIPALDKEFNRSIKQYQNELDDWTFVGASLPEISNKFHDWSVSLWSQFIPSSWNSELVNRPEFFFKFQHSRRGVLGHYYRGRNDFGARYEISINPSWLPFRTEADTVAVLLHELTHAFEDIVGISSKSRNGYHTKWFRNQLEEIGIPCSQYGQEEGRINPSPFTKWASKNSVSETSPIIPNPKFTPLKYSKKSKRLYWFCSCIPLPIRVYVARGITLKATCNVCGTSFQRQRIES